jgi:hypothetical protein
VFGEIANVNSVPELRTVPTIVSTPESRAAEPLSVPLPLLVVPSSLDVEDPYGPMKMMKMPMGPMPKPPMPGKPMPKPGMPPIPMPMPKPGMPGMPMMMMMQMTNAADTAAMQKIQSQMNKPLNTGNYKGINGFSQTKDGALVFKGKMDTDCDGAKSCPKIDPSGQTSTSYTYKGQPIDALKANYVVLPGDLAAKTGHKYQLGDVVAVSYNGKTAYGIYADNGPAGKAGEGSVHLTQELGFNPYCGSKICKGIDSGVSYVVFPNSKNSYTNPYDNASISAAGSNLLHQNLN